MYNYYKNMKRKNRDTVFTRNERPHLLKIKDYIGQRQRIARKIISKMRYIKV